MATEEKTTEEALRGAFYVEVNRRCLAEEKLRITLAAFDEIEAHLGKLLGLTRTEMAVESIIKQARSLVGAM